MLTCYRTSLKFALLALLPMFSSQALASDNFVMSNEENQHVIVGDAPMPEATHDIGGGQESSDAEAPAPQQTAGMQRPRHEHLKPELPAGWSSPDDVAISTGGNGVLGIAGMGNNAGYSNSNYGNTNVMGSNTGNMFSNFVGLGSGASVTPNTNSIGTPSSAVGTVAGLAGNLRVGTGSRNSTPVLPTGYISPQQGNGGIAGNSLAGFPAIPPALLGNGLAGMAAGEGGEDGTVPTTAQERAQMAAFFAALMQYVMSQPDTNFNLTTALANNRGYGYGSGASVGSSSVSANLHGQAAQGVAASNCGVRAGVALSGCR